MPRPTVMTQDIQEKICADIAEGKSLRSICVNNELPSLSTVMLAVVQNRDGFRNSYTHAREAAGYAHGDGVVEVVELLRNGTIDPQTAKAMMDGLKWAAERMAPKSHSQRQEIDHTTGGDKMQAESIDASKLSNTSLKELMDARNSSESD